MASELLGAEGSDAYTTPSKSAQPSTWAARWDMWWMRVAAFGWVLLMLYILFNLERFVSASSLWLKLEIAAPLLIALLTASEVWKAGRGGRMEKKLADSVIGSIFLILWLLYKGTVDLTHFLR